MLKNAPLSRLNRTSVPLILALNIGRRPVMVIGNRTISPSWHFAAPAAAGTPVDHTIRENNQTRRRSSVREGLQCRLTLGACIHGTPISAFICFSLPCDEVARQKLSFRRQYEAAAVNCVALPIAQRAYWSAPARNK